MEKKVGLIFVISFVLYMKEDVKELLEGKKWKARERVSMREVGELSGYACWWLIVERQWSSPSGGEIAHFLPCTL